MPRGSFLILRLPCLALGFLRSALHDQPDHRLLWRLLDRLRPLICPIANSSSAKCPRRNKRRRKPSGVHLLSHIVTDRHQAFAQRSADPVFPRYPPLSRLGIGSVHSFNEFCRRAFDDTDAPSDQPLAWFGLLGFGHTQTLGIRLA